ncbi:MAG: hypothetical protein U0556_07325 [Dehalococcoidia bacterium]
MSAGGYRLVLSRPGLLSLGDPGRWELRFEQGSAVRTVANGGLLVFNTSETSANQLVLVARGRSGYLWVNGAFADALDLSAANGARTLRLVGDQPSAYRDFEVQAQ